jgi:hypothetical protein
VHLTGCGGHTVAEHVCYHERRRWSDRSHQSRPGVCTLTRSEAHQVIQPCMTCPLHQPERLLSAQA